MQIIKNPSPNFSPRNSKISFIIIHYTAMTFEGALKALCNKETMVSSHYLIKDTGDIFQLVDDNLAAHHAGVSFWNEISSLNHCSIGIELDNMGNTEFSLPQIAKCIELCKKLVSAYNIPRENILGHSDIAPNRKIDPGIYFDWQYLAKHNLGIWHSADTIKNPKILHKFGDKGAEIITLQDRLKKFGFKIETTGVFDKETNFVIRAFQSHFYPEIIKQCGIEFYQNASSKYSWDEKSDSILFSLK